MTISQSKAMTIMVLTILFSVITASTENWREYNLGFPQIRLNLPVRPVKSKFTDPNIKKPDRHEVFDIKSSDIELKIHVVIDTKASPKAQVKNICREFCLANIRASRLELKVQDAIDSSTGDLARASCFCTGGDDQWVYWGEVGRRKESMVMIWGRGHKKSRSAAETTEKVMTGLTILASKK